MTVGAWLWRRDRPLVWAHRGASAHATENTLAAFALAEPHGADGIELDVQCCATGEVVVFHDDDLRRLADRPERIAATPWSDLRDVALRGDHRMPLLADVFAATALPINVELKSFDPGQPGPLPAAAVRAIAAHPGAADRVVVSSFDHIALWQLHAIAPHLPIGFLFEPDAPSPPRTLGGSSIHPPHARCTPEAVAAWHALGLAVHAWTVDDPDRLRALAAAGVDGVFANDPRAARAILASR